MFIYILSRLSLPDQIISTKKNIHVFGNIGSLLGIVVKCFQSNRSSLQSLQSPHPTHHIFNFTTFPIGHTPTITQKSTCSPIKPHTTQTILVNAIRTHRHHPKPNPSNRHQWNVLIKRPQKPEKTDPLTTSSPNVKQASHNTPNFQSED